MACPTWGNCSYELDKNWCSQIACDDTVCHVPICMMQSLATRLDQQILVSATSTDHRWLYPLAAVCAVVFAFALGAVLSSWRAYCRKRTGAHYLHPDSSDADLFPSILPGTTSTTVREESRSPAQEPLETPPSVSPRPSPFFQVEATRIPKTRVRVSTEP